jgi:hypothetical protein
LRKKQAAVQDFSTPQALDEKPLRAHEDVESLPDSGLVLGESADILSVAWMTEGKEERPEIQFAGWEDGACGFRGLVAAVTFFV